ncbi:hypothetical protein PV721_30890 [Streptomyces sp. MB09-01]|uniref:hypothetical protein n=1 Tax=Streptomyces sp. MB09-01 TaxID=3028666 RepID=UPI0029B17F42|nr:hypothetical protein [Streptomyces sp. MB09-01]MDX3538673.1 hypothetical protein [Streptomyces sp. MB09-01]
MRAPLEVLSSVGRHGALATVLAALGLGGPQSVAGQLVPEFSSGGGLHHGLHGGQQLDGTRVMGGEVHAGERAVVDGQGEAVAEEDVGHAEDVLVASYKAELCERRLGVIGG